MRKRGSGNPTCFGWRSRPATPPIPRRRPPREAAHPANPPHDAAHPATPPIPRIRPRKNQHARRPLPDNRTCGERSSWVRLFFAGSPARARFPAAAPPGSTGALRIRPPATNAPESGSGCRVPGRSRIPLELANIDSGGSRSHALRTFRVKRRMPIHLAKFSLL